jgi:hypothetical protein
MSRVEADAPLMRTDRRAMKAVRMVSPSPGLVAMRRRRLSRGITMTSPASFTRADTKTRRPERRLSSPRKRPGPCCATIVVSSAPSCATTSIAPDTTTMKS